MNEKPTVSFNFMTDMNVPDGYLVALQDGIKFVFDNYFVHTEYKLPKSISTYNQIWNRPAEKMSFETFFSEYFENYDDSLQNNEFNIMLTKHFIIHDLALHSICNSSLASKACFLIVFPISKYKYFINPNAVFEDCVRHELLHSHYIFNFKNVFYTNNDFFSEDHCIDTNCLMAPSKNYNELTKPYDLCDRCKENIKKFTISKETLKNNIRNSRKTTSDELSEQEVIKIINLYDKICPRWK